MDNAGVEVKGIGHLIAFARRSPATALRWVLVFHLIIWTLLPPLVSPNLQLDLLEGLALGKEWQLGYWKHPPLPWWLDDLFYRITGSVDVVYLLGPLASVACFYGVWRLAREAVGEFQALIAVLALEGIHFYNFSAVKFAQDQLQLPFWAFTCFFFYRALTRGWLRDWGLAGVFLAGAFWSKYAVLALALTLGSFLLLDSTARRTLRTPGPYVMAAVFLLVIAPNVWWLIENNFLPLRYVGMRADTAALWWQYVAYPLQWTAGEFLFLLPAIVLIALVRPPRLAAVTLAEPRASFDRRYVTALALGPFVLTTLGAAVTGRLPVAMWGYSFWSFAPLAALMWLEAADDPVRLRWFARALIAVIVGWPLIYALVEIGEPFVRDRAKESHFPGRLLAATVTQHWRAQTGQPLSYVGGSDVGRGAGEAAANNVAVYSRDRPRVLVHGDLTLSAWIDPDDLDRRGLVLVWASADADPPESMRRNFPRLQMQRPLVLPRQTLYPRPPFTVRFAIVPPRP